MYQYTAKVYPLVFRKALSVPKMDTNPIPPFIMIESGPVVKDTAKIHAMDIYLWRITVYISQLRHSNYVFSAWCIIIILDF